jgi:putative PIN family toxin of toxin-antitoxin system
MINLAGMMVIDTDVVVAALRSPAGASAELLRRVLNLEVAVALSVAMVLEYEAVSTRPEHLRVGGLSEQDVRIVLDAMVQVSKQVDINYRWRPQLRDADDEMVLEAAVNASASIIVTFNRQDFIIATQLFGIDVLTPAEMLRRL